LAVLAAAAFIYVTAEILPVGALPAIAHGLHVSVPMVGTLLAWYALVAAVTTIPLVRWTAHWPRRRALLLSLAFLTASQLISAVAPNFIVLAGGRVLSAITHGLMLSVLAPIATRLTKAGINQLPETLDAALQWDALAQPLTMATEDIHEGIRAIHERRAPSFKGR